MNDNSRAGTNDIAAGVISSGYSTTAMIAPMTRTCQSLKESWQPQRSGPDETEKIVKEPDAKTAAKGTSENLAPRT